MTIKCSKCGGRGSVDLPQRLQSTLDCVRKRKAVTAEIVCAELGEKCHTTAINNRLEQLRALHVIDRKPHGRGYVYFPTKNSK